MKISIVLPAFILAISLLPLTGAPKADLAPPKEGFKTLAGLKAWANKHEWTGGSAGLLKIKGKSVFFSIRSFTSGRHSSEVIFYWLNTKGEIHPFLIIPTQMKGLNVTEEKDSIVLKEYSDQTKKWIELMKFNSLLLPLNAK